MRRNGLTLLLYAKVKLQLCAGRRRALAEKRSNNADIICTIVQFVAVKRLPTRSKLADKIFHPRVALAESDQEVQHSLSVTRIDCIPHLLLSKIGKASICHAERKDYNERMVL